MDFVKDAVTVFVGFQRDVSPPIPLAILSFAQRGSIRFGDTGSCDPVEDCVTQLWPPIPNTFLELRETNADAVLDSLDVLFPGGLTPIGQAIVAATPFIGPTDRGG
jgi:hypothetical protein